MKLRIYALINAAIIAAIFLLPGQSITAANIAAETGLLTRVGGEHTITLTFANDMGLALPNIVTIIGVLLIVNTLIAVAYQLRSVQA
ncbi:hypothetical protein [Gordonia malaquae]|uniref:hypothetical protein n=1 Tax=Gordonia malaquae TaxID=410332 RepID=UPI003018C974